MYLTENYLSNGRGLFVNETADRYNQEFAPELELSKQENRLPTLYSAKPEQSERP